MAINRDTNYEALLDFVMERMELLEISTMLLNRTAVAKILGRAPQHINKVMPFPEGAKYVTPVWLAKQLDKAGR